MRLQFESGAAIDNPSESDFERIPAEEFAILSRDEGTYLQCLDAPEPDWEYVLEYQDGSVQAHFTAVDHPITLDRVVDAFTKYLHDDPSWKADFQWERIDV